MATTTMKGHIAQLEVERRATEKGYVVSRPVIEARYDLVVDNWKRLFRVQVKYTAHSTDNGGSLTVGLRKFGGNKDVGVRTRDVKTYTADEVDILAVYSPITGKVYWFPIGQFDGKTCMRIRLKPSKNNQRKRVLFAKDFEW